MRFTIQAACGCHTGKIRKTNEDNFCFGGKCLEENNSGLKRPVRLEGTLKKGFCVAIFDGMGGENFGELASFAAAHQMQAIQRRLSDCLIPKKKFLERLTLRLNEAVAREQQKMRTDRMGTTMVCLYLTGRYAYICNAGDSRAYRLRDGDLLQLSKDHAEKRPGQEGKKAPLTQYLGIGAEEIEIEPYIAKGELKKGDTYLLCSDGLSDMLTNFEITDIMLNNADPETCVQKLIDSALEHGGRDNITAIVCKLI